LHKCLQERDEKPKTFRQLDATKNGNKKFLGKKFQPFLKKRRLKEKESLELLERCFVERIN
jgi:hypothetical protein